MLFGDKGLRDGGGHASEYVGVTTMYVRWADHNSCTPGELPPTGIAMKKMGLLQLYDGIHGGSSATL